MDFKSFVYNIVHLINTAIIPLIFGVALVSFLFGMVRYYFLNGANAEDKEKARSFMLWGLLGMVLLFSVWGLISIAHNTLLSL